MPTASDKQRASSSPGRGHAGRERPALRTRERPRADTGVLQGDAGETVDGTEGNERLTAVTGVALLVLLAILGVTILRLNLLIWEHLFVGLVLIGPVLVKLASTGYRFIRYYSGNSVYVRKGPPPILLRTLGPLVVFTTLLVFGSGLALLFGGPSARGTFFPIHKLSFIAWLAIMAVHVLGHLPSLPKALRGDYATRKNAPGYVPGRDGRMITLAGALVAGLVLAVVLIPDFSAWTSAHAVLTHHHH
jgi:hypothetical protein